MGTYSKKMGKYVRSGSKKGMADITSIINGKHVSIEIKTGRDKMRPDQLKVRDEVEAAGGIYIVASTFDNFLEQIKNQK
jgi:Holliday junction resolvase